MTGYKGFNEDLTCRNFKYEIGETYEMKKRPIVCERGFHFCKELKNVFNYYPLYKKYIFCEIEAYNNIISDNNEKYCTNKIKIIRVLSLDEILDIIGIKDKDLFKKYYNDKFNERQMQQIRFGLEKGLDVSSYAKLEFNEYQMQEIMLGLEGGLNVSIYAKSEFDSYQMNQIMLGLLDDLDISIYAKPEFDDAQMRQIRFGLKKGLDVSIYAKSEFDDYQMEEIRHGLMHRIYWD